MTDILEAEEDQLAAERAGAPASLGSMSAADLDWVENWLIQKRGTEHAARPYGMGSLLLTTLTFEVRRERRRRTATGHRISNGGLNEIGLGEYVPTDETPEEIKRRFPAGGVNHMDHVTAAEAERIGDTPDLKRRRKALRGHEDHPGYGHALHGGTGERQGVYAPSETKQIKRGERTGVLVGIGLPALIIAAVVAGLMWWHTGGVLPQ